MRSTIPPQSPVAWGSFISGADPGVFGIFDFLHRNPENYTPMFSQSETLPAGMMVNLGKYQIPLKPGKVVLKREGPRLLGLPGGPRHPGHHRQAADQLPAVGQLAAHPGGHGHARYPGHLRHLLALHLGRERSAGRHLPQQRLLRLYRRERRHGGADRRPQERPGQGRRKRGGAVQGLRGQQAQDRAHRHPGPGNPDRRKGILRLGGDRVLPDQPPGQHHRHGQVLPDGNGREVPPLHLPHPHQPARAGRAHQHARRATAASWPTRSACSTPSACRPTPRP